MQQLEKPARRRCRCAAPEERADAAEPMVKPKLVTDEEADEYGEEFLDVVGKRAKEEYAPEFDELAERLKRLEGRVEGVGTVIEKTQDAGPLPTRWTTRCPNWRDINRSDEFKPGCSSSTRIRAGSATKCSRKRSLDTKPDRVVTFFQGFLTEATGLPQTPQARITSAPPLPATGNGSGKPSLEDFAAPGRARSAPQQLPPDKPVYSSAWIAKFMADKRTGKYRGREADADAIERDIYQAQHEGRIQ